MLSLSRSDYLTASPAGHRTKAGESWDVFVSHASEDKEAIAALCKYRSGTSYSEAVRELQKAFLIAVLRDVNGIQVRAARQLGMHRNSLRRNLQELDLDIKSMRGSPRRPPLSARPLAMRDKNAAAP